MCESIRIRPAIAQDSPVVASILTEAAEWQEQAGSPIWLEGELAIEKIGAEVAAGLFFLAEREAEPAGTVKFQLEDALFWPDRPTPDAAYIHRLAVRRRFRGQGVSTALLKWAAQRTQQLGRRFLRLDCDAHRPRLRGVYESFGFRHHSDRQVGPYFVARYEYDTSPHRE
jgi:GNAT superfamily N-acetyltransferase